MTKLPRCMGCAACLRGKWSVSNGAWCSLEWQSSCGGRSVQHVCPVHPQSLWLPVAHACTCTPTPWWRRPPVVPWCVSVPLCGAFCSVATLAVALTTLTHVCKPGPEIRLWYLNMCLHTIKKPREHECYQLCLNPYQVTQRKSGKCNCLRSSWLWCSPLRGAHLLCLCVAETCHTSVCVCASNRWSDAA